MTENEFFERIRESQLPVVVDFWAPWCGPCRMVDPLLKKLGQEYAGRVDVWKVNADEHPGLLRKLGIRGIPTLVAFRNGEEITRRTGAASIEVFGALFEAAVSGERPSGLGLAQQDRLIRLVAGVILLVLAYQGGFQGLNLVAAGLGVMVLFSAVYDRCPVYKLLTARIKEWRGRKTG